MVVKCMNKSVQLKAPSVIVLITFLMFLSGCGTDPMDSANGKVALTITSETVKEYHNYSPIHVTFTFSEDVGGFTSDDIEITNGTISTFQSEAGAPSYLYSADIVPVNDGLVEVSVGAGVAQNEDGELNKASNIFTTEFRGFNHGLITDLIPGPSADIVYAVDYSNGELLTIDLTKPGIVSKIALNHNNPVSAVLDQTDGYLYVIDKAPYLDVYDTSTVSPTIESSLSLSSGYLGQDLALDAGDDRLYVLKRESSSGEDGYLDCININDPSNLSTIFTDQSLYISDSSSLNVNLSVTGDEYHSVGMALAASDVNEFLYISNIGISPSTLYKYDTSGNYLDSIQSGGFGEMLAINSSETSLVFNTRNGNDSNSSYDIYEFNLSMSMVDQWHMDGSRPYAVSFSHDEQRIYMTDKNFTTGGTLYIFDAATTHDLVETYSFPRADEYSRIAESNDGKYVIGASCDWDGTMSRIFYFPVP